MSAKAPVCFLVVRFQIPDVSLHPGYRFLIQTAVDSGEYVHFVVCTTTKISHKNILSAEQRTRIIRRYMSRYPDTVLGFSTIADHPSDHEWYRELGRIMNEVAGEQTPDCLILCSRDSVFDFPFDYPCQKRFIEPLGKYNSTAIRAELLSRDYTDNELVMKGRADYALSHDDPMIDEPDYFVGWMLGFHEAN
jgi:hypothetical protein